MKKLIVIILSVLSNSFMIAQDCEHITRSGTEKPGGYYLGKLLPKPYSPGLITTTEFGLIDTSKISIGLYDADGHSIYSSKCRLSGGNYVFDWNFLFGKPDFISGIYFFKIKSVYDGPQKYAEMYFEGSTKIVFVK